MSTNAYWPDPLFKDLGAVLNCIFWLQQLSKHQLRNWTYTLRLTLQIKVYNGGSFSNLQYKKHLSEVILVPLLLRALLLAHAIRAVLTESVDRFCGLCTDRLFDRWLLPDKLFTGTIDFVCPGRLISNESWQPHFVLAGFYLSFDHDQVLVTSNHFSAT